MAKIIITGAGAAPGVPCLSQGFGACNPNNPKNFRLRSGTYIELSGVKFLIDTSPDLRLQLLNNNIRMLDAVFYTHAHADHLHGIDDLREINRISGEALDIYASAFNMDVIKQRFGYLVIDDEKGINPIYRAALRPHVFHYDESFYVQQLKVTPIHLNGHNLECTGYIFNDGEIVYAADFKSIPEEELKNICRPVEVMVMPLTTPEGTRFHAGFDELMHLAAEIKPKRLIINHMAAECDYDTVMSACQAAHLTDVMILPAYDGLTVEF